MSNPLQYHADYKAWRIFKVLLPEGGYSAYDAETNNLAAISRSLTGLHSKLDKLCERAKA